jgi:hypothetical protein
LITLWVPISSCQSLDCMWMIDVSFIHQLLRAPWIPVWNLFLEIVLCTFYACTSTCAPSICTWTPWIHAGDEYKDPSTLQNILHQAVGEHERLWKRKVISCVTVIKHSMRNQFLSLCIFFCWYTVLFHLNYKINDLLP